MRRTSPLAGITVIALAACGGRIEDPVVTCDPAAADTCPDGFHCAADGTCEADSVDDGGGGGTDASCPAIHFQPMPVIPSVVLLIDGSGSMDDNDIAPTRYGAVREGLVGTDGVVNALESQVYFGASIYEAADPCPTLHSVARGLDNAAAIASLIDGYTPGGFTPTAPAIDQVVADFQADPPPAGSPPVIVLATDGEPNGCADSTPNLGPSITAAENAYAAGIRLYILGLAGLNTAFLQDMANAGMGVQPGDPDAPYYTANDPATLQDAFATIIGGVLSCDLAITGGTIDTAQAEDGIVVLNGVTLTYGVDWILVDGMTIRLIGAACDELTSSADPTVDASFPCGAVVN
jgi:hypothetical protein